MLLDTIECVVSLKILGMESVYSKLAEQLVGELVIHAVSQSMFAFYAKPIDKLSLFAQSYILQIQNFTKCTCFTFRGFTITASGGRKLWPCSADRNTCRCSWGPALSVLLDEIPGIPLLSLWNNSSGTESCSLYSIFYFSFDYLISSRFVWRFVDSAYLRHDVQNMKWWLQRWGQQPGFPCNMDSAGSRGANLSSMISPNPNQEPTRYLIGIDCGIHV